jgi:hypothetical protein
MPAEFPDVKPSPETSSPELSDLDRALVEAAAEMSFDWPESLPVDGIIIGMLYVGLGCLLFAGLIALGVLPFATRILDQ